MDEPRHVADILLYERELTLLNDRPPLALLWVARSSALNSSKSSGRDGMCSPQSTSICPPVQIIAFENSVCRYTGPAIAIC